MSTFFNKSYVAAKTWWPLIIIVLAGFFLRFWHLSQLPSTVFADEYVSGYLGRYILENGVDLYGKSWPIYFDTFGDYYITGPMYLDGLSIYLFGVNTFAIRFPTAFIGSLTILLVAGLVWEMFRSKLAAIWSGAFLAFSPWHIVLSRVTTESVIEMALVLAGILAFLVAVRRQSVKLVIVSITLFLLSYLTYHTTRVVSPALWFVFLTIFWRALRQSKKMLIAVIIGFSLMTGLTAYISLQPWGAGRFSQTSIFSEQSGVAGRMLSLTYDLGPNQLLGARVFHNKFVGFSREFISQYLTYFSTNFLVLNGWKDSRYVVPESGPVLIISLAVIAAGLFFSRGIWKKTDARFKLLCVALMLISPIPASLTSVESPNIRRSVLLLLPLAVLFALSIANMPKFGKIFQRVFMMGLGVFFLAEFAFFWFQYTQHVDSWTSFYRGDGNSQLVQELLKNQGDGHRRWVADREAIGVYYLFQKQDFSREWSKRFQYGLKISQIDDTQFFDADCIYRPGLPDFDLMLGDLIYENQACKIDETRFKEREFIRGVNPLLGFHVLEYAPSHQASEDQS